MEPRKNLFSFALELISRTKEGEDEREDDLVQRIHGPRRGKKIARRNNDGHTTMPSHLIERKKSLMSRLFEERTAFLSLLLLSPPPQQKSYMAVHETTYQTADMEQCTCLQIKIFL